MKKLLPIWIILGILVLAAMVVYSARNNNRIFDERVTLRQQDKIPYGTSVAKRLLPDLFPGARIYYDGKHPGYWDSIRSAGYNQAVILMSKDFEAEHHELQRILNFVENGNYVFIIAKSFSGDTRRLFSFSYSTEVFGDQAYSGDEFLVQLNQDYFPGYGDKSFPGTKYDGWFTSVDTSITHELGMDRYGRTNFIRIDKGEGSIFIHSAPVVFSNYFILHHHNYEYFQKVMSVLPANMRSVLWNDYYLNKPAQNKQEDRSNWLAVLFRYDSFKWGLLTAILALVLFVLLNSRRLQRMVPLHSRPRNDSLDFVKTMGRLYHEKRDHLDLARKMGMYFLEHVRRNYRLSTQELNEDFVYKLHVKTGYPENGLKYITGFINRLHFADSVHENELAAFHRQLELFYQKN